MLNFECAFLRLYHKDAVWQLGEVDVDGARVVGLQAFYYFAIQDTTSTLEPVKPAQRVSSRNCWRS